MTDLNDGELYRLAIFVVFYMKGYLLLKEDDKNYGNFNNFSMYYISNFNCTSNIFRRYISGVFRPNNSNTSDSIIG